MSKRGFIDDGADIARELGITRQAVSNTLKRAMKKFYLNVKKLNPEMHPFAVAVQMMKMFEVYDSEEVTKFFHLFPPEIRDEIKNDVVSSGMGKAYATNENFM